MQRAIARPSWPFWIVCAFVVIAFLFGGSARPSSQSILVLRPIAVLACGIGLLTLKRAQVRANRFLFGMTAAIFALVLLHLVPLPPAIWHLLPGRDLIREIDQLAFAQDVWRPLSMAPSASWNALYALFVPLAVLLLGVQLDRMQLARLVYVLLGLGLITSLLGLLQLVGDPQGPLYFYRVTNNGSAVGLFANRNHQAMFLAMQIPLIAVAAHSGMQRSKTGSFRTFAAIGACLLLVPLLLTTGSRAGLLLGIFGLACVASLNLKPGAARDGGHWRRVGLIAAAVIALAGLALFLSRAEALQRLLGQGISGDREEIWRVSMHLIWKYMPFGSGIGSLVETYFIDEPSTNLGPVYINHVHNDWLEIVLTAGMPGAILLGIACWVLLRSGFRAFGGAARHRPGNTHARLGAVLVAMFALGSIGDYPLRTPALACMFVIAALWLVGSASTEESDGTPN